jgi:hypothetical protein
LTPKPPATRRRTKKRTELRRTSAQAERRLAKEAAEREWRVFLTAKFDRTWKAMIRFRTKVGAPRFRELMTELPSTIENIGSSDQRGVAEFFVLLGPERFEEYVAEMMETLETGSDPGAFWAKWIDVVCERTKTRADAPEGFA